MRLAREEQVVRAICSEHFDPENGRISPSLYEGKETSVSRLTVVPIKNQWTLLAATVQKLPGRRLEKLGELGVATIEDLGQAYTQNEKPAPVVLTVVDDPTPQNAAHAIIPEKISKGLSRTMVKVSTIHDPPAGFDPEKVPKMV
jgi:hypothetical protein